MDRYILKSTALHRDGGEPQRELPIEPIDNNARVSVAIQELSKISLTHDRIGTPLYESVRQGSKPKMAIQSLIRGSRLFETVLPYVKEHDRTVISVSGLSGVGKTEVATILGSYFVNRDIATYIVACDNYERLIHSQNDERRRQIFQEGGLARLAEYLCSNEEVDFKMLNSIVRLFLEGKDRIPLRLIDVEQQRIIEDETFLDAGEHQVLILEGTWSAFVSGPIYRVFLDTIQALTLERRFRRKKDPLGYLDEKIQMIEYDILRSTREFSDCIMYDDCSLEFLSPETRFGFCSLRHDSKDQAARVDLERTQISEEFSPYEESYYQLDFPQIETALQKSKELLRYLSSGNGFLASKSKVGNYKRVWARDGVIIGLAALLSEEEELVKEFELTLFSLTKHQGENGEIPSNIQFDDNGDVTHISYGSIIGRVDTVLWYIIGVASLITSGRSSKDIDYYKPAIQKVLHLLEVWEFNGRGLVYVPQGGTWADEYESTGYVLFMQVLRLWASELLDGLSPTAFKRKRSSVELRELIEINYIPQEKYRLDKRVYHKKAYDTILDGERSPWGYYASFDGGGYVKHYDFFGSCLAILLNLGDSEEQLQNIITSTVITEASTVKMPPAFWPPIFPADPEWHRLSQYYLYEFNNHPFCYHNGGSWPMLAGWWIYALVRCNRLQQANDAFLSLIHFCQAGKDSDDEWGFYEWSNSSTGTREGTKHQGWSASAVLMAYHALGNKKMPGLSRGGFKQ